MTMTSPTPPGTDFAFDTAIRGLADQMRWIDALDTKAGVLMAADAVLAGVVLTRGSILLGAPVWLGVAVAVLLLSSLLLALLSFATRRFELAPDIPGLASAATVESERSLRWTALPAVQEALAMNEPKIAQKANLLFCSGCALMAAAVFFGGYFIFDITR
jgi:hypothetical protein